MDNFDTTSFRHHHHHGSPIWAFILIAFGILLLLNNFGVVSIDVWRQIWQFWPLVLILIGAQLILGHSLISRIIIDILAVILIALVVLYSIALTDPTFNQWVSHYLPMIHLNNPLQSNNNPFQFNHQRKNMSNSSGSYFYSY